MVSTSIYQSLFDTSQSAFFFAKIDGTILEANKAACEMFGYSEDELKRLGGANLLDTSDNLFTQMLSVKQREGTIKGILTGIRKNGEYFPVAYSSVRLKNADGEEIASIVATDISDQKIRNINAHNYWKKPRKPIIRKMRAGHYWRMYWIVLQTGSLLLT